MLTVEIQTKVWLEMSGVFVIGEGGLDLLRNVERLQSLTGAARAVGWSYRHAWGYLRNAAQRLGSPLVITSPGKGSRRGTTLSPIGSDILRRLDGACELVKVTAARHWASA
jgi:molybdate transport system regulatory protein